MPPDPRDLIELIATVSHRFWQSEEGRLEEIRLLASAWLEAQGQSDEQRKE